MDIQSSTKSPFAEMELEHSADPPLQDDDVVITGISSLMPGCQNLKEWSDKLYNKVRRVFVGLWNQLGCKTCAILKTQDFKVV